MVFFFWKKIQKQKQNIANLYIYFFIIPNRKGPKKFRERNIVVKDERENSGRHNEKDDSKSVVLLVVGVSVLEAHQIHSATSERIGSSSLGDNQ